jgi:hypothetical protein
VSDSPAAPAAGAPDARPRPASLIELFLVFSALALRGSGGVLPWAQRVLVDDRGWLSREEFVEMLAFGQMLPGPNVCNVALMVGDRWFGWRGALAALGGMLAAPCVVVLSLAVLYGQGRRRSGRAARADRHGRGRRRHGSRHRPAAGDDAALWAMTAGAALVVWRTRVNLLWLVGAGRSSGCSASSDEAPTRPARARSAAA